MELKKRNQSRMPLARSTRRHHPYPRPVYPDPDEENTPYEPRIDDDSLLYLIRDANHRPIRHVRVIENGNEDEDEEDVEEGNNGLIVGGLPRCHSLLRETCAFHGFPVSPRSRRRWTMSAATLAFLVYRIQYFLFWTAFLPRPV
ncbi:hypothetical protein Moror_8668 [Moniliophthora roreri MCA 2997]|uniref:Uncharacterized protein n=1 Tax=Moniliophthora roreri (strain MCA 2997) TaxID=1381753 RepID=V2X756_MONRO|nr:hypothetical protein Moror_8668 [Moniliophthora roreri MCA 2997]